MALPGDAIYRDCPWCATRSVQLIIQANTRGITNSNKAVREWTWLSCPRCAGVISLETHPQIKKVLQEVPNHTTDVDVAHLPEDVEEYYRNALIVLNTGVASAAAVELRRTLEAAAKHKGIDITPLARAIQKLVDEGWITKDFEQVMVHVKKIGNVGAHAGQEKLTEPEVQTALKFTTQILRNLFEIPKELELLGNQDEATHE